MKKNIYIYVHFLINIFFNKFSLSNMYIYVCLFLSFLECAISKI